MYPQLSARAREVYVKLVDFVEQVRQGFGFESKGVCMCVSYPLPACLPASLCALRHGYILYTTRVPHPHINTQPTHIHATQECLPAEATFEAQHKALPSRWMIPPIVEELKAKARALVRSVTKTARCCDDGLDRH